MRVIVFSDSHGDFDALCRVVDAQPGAEVFLHLGDGAREAGDLQDLYPQKRIILVRGNCDWGCAAKDEELITLAGKRIFLAHGHTLDVKRGQTKLLDRASSLGADIACFGHTHSPFSAWSEALCLLNPGSVSSPRTGAHPTYATIDIDPEGAAISIAEL